MIGKHYILRNDIYHFALIQRDVDTFFMVGGGVQYTGFTTKILKYESGVWTHVGDLQHGRSRHRLAFNDNQLLILGGWSNTSTDNDAT